MVRPRLHDGPDSLGRLRTECHPRLDHTPRNAADTLAGPVLDCPGLRRLWIHSVPRVGASGFGRHRSLSAGWLRSGTVPLRIHAGTLARAIALGPILRRPY